MRYLSAIKNDFGQWWSVFQGQKLPAVDVTPIDEGNLAALLVAIVTKVCSPVRAVQWAFRFRASLFVDHFSHDCNAGNVQ